VHSNNTGTGTRPGSLVISGNLTGGPSKKKRCTEGGFLSMWFTTVCRVQKSHRAPQEKKKQRETEKKNAKKKNNLRGRKWGKNRNRGYRSGRRRHQGEVHRRHKKRGAFTQIGEKKKGKKKKKREQTGGVKSGGGCVFWKPGGVSG